uniref:Putative secreted protein n=1 Tax=Anopheles darlingi TaxID=43151 RepID=A0A2M4DJW7_ANODA
MCRNALLCSLLCSALSSLFFCSSPFRRIRDPEQNPCTRSPDLPEIRWTNAHARTTLWKVHAAGLLFLPSFHSSASPAGLSRVSLHASASPGRQVFGFFFLSLRLSFNFRSNSCSCRFVAL